MMRAVINKVLRRFHRLISFILRRPDFFSEECYWSDWLQDNWADISSKESWAKIFPDRLGYYIDELSKSAGRSIKLLEIGSGPISILAYAVQEKLCDVVAIDPLADFYKKMMKGFGYSYPVVPVKGTAERLLDVVCEDSFDIAYSSNALDHAKSPKVCLDNIYHVIKPGGYIFLEGYSREGTNMKWWGLHKHDIFPNGERLCCKDKLGNLTVLTDGIKLKCVYLQVIKAKERARGTPFVRASDDDWYTMIFKKE